MPRTGGVSSGPAERGEWVAQGGKPTNIMTRVKKSFLESRKRQHVPQAAANFLAPWKRNINNVRQHPAKAILNGVSRHNVVRLTLTSNTCTSKSNDKGQRRVRRLLNKVVFSFLFFFNFIGTWGMFAFCCDWISVPLPRDPLNTDCVGCCSPWSSGCKVPPNGSYCQSKFRPVAGGSTTFIKRCHQRSQGIQTVTLRRDHRSIAARLVAMRVVSIASSPALNVLLIRHTYGMLMRTSFFAPTEYPKSCLSKIEALHVVTKETANLHR